MKKTVGFLMALVFLLSCALTPYAAEKKVPTREIGVVFDNSGSMYVRGNQAWCRATYAMEVFAAMMNDGDTMRVYPMHPVDVEGTEYTGAKPLTIAGPGNAGLIRKMFTKDAEGTPIETIDDAFNGIRGGNGERWLVVLTDGDTFDVDDVTLQKAQTEEKLTERLGAYSADMNVLYLGIGAGAAMPKTSSGGKYQFYADKAGDSAQVLTKLTEMCNMIFGRDTLDVSGKEADVDLSLKKLIVFVQGKDVSNVSVTDAAGAPVGTKVSEYETKYSELGAGGPNQGKAVDNNLQGRMVTFADCKAGKYSLSFDGSASSAVAYYEPDVDLVVQLVDQGGNVIDPSRDAYAGDYTIRYGLVDNQTGKLTESALLGKTHYDVTYSVNGQTYEVSSDKKQDSTTVTLAAGDTLDATIDAEYLSGYRITKNSGELGWPNFRIVPRAIDPEKFRVELTGGKTEYLLSELETAPYTMQVYYDGELLTGEALRRAVPQIAVEGGNVGVEYAVNAQGDGFDVGLRYNEDAQHTDCGDFALNYAVDYTNADGESGISGNQQTPFSVVNDGFRLRAELTAEQTYYLVSELETGLPLVLHLSKNGEPLTDEELAAAQIEVDADGLGYELEMLPGQSAYNVNLRSAENVKGRHTVRCTATATDALGQTTSDSDAVGLEVQSYPLWLRWLIIGLALLLLLILLWLFLNHKVLPKRISRGSDSEFSIGGKAIEGNAEVGYNRSGKTMKISPPTAPSYPLVACAASLSLAPDSPRRTPSAKRKVRVTDVRASGEISSIEIGSALYERDENGRFVKEGNTPTYLANRSTVTINGVAMGNNGRRKTAILSQTLRFK